MSDRQLRKRIPLKQAGKSIHDPLEFKTNKCSNNANHVTTVIQNIDIHLWYDKHYHIREQLGDENGKREGIERKDIQELVLTAIKHMMFYSAILSNFKYLNHNYNRSTGRAIRVVCQNNNLNVIIEAHMVSVNEYEITVITAMNKEDFTLSDGQYAIEMLESDLSVLKFSSRGKISEVYSI